MNEIFLPDYVNAASNPAIVKKTLNCRIAAIWSILPDNPAKPDNAIKPSEKQKCFSKCFTANTILIQKWHFLN